MRRLARLALAAGLLAAGCAPLPQEPAGVPVPPAPAPVAVATPAPPRAAVASPATPDTTPSPAALAVLASIPEPVPVATNAPPRGGRKPESAQARPTGVSSSAPAAAYDTLMSAPETESSMQASVGAASDPAIPVPAPTRALGQGAVTPAPTPAAPAPMPPPVSPAPAVAAAPPAAVATAPAEADTCWRVQVGAPSVRAKASRLREASESQLMMRMVVEVEGGLFKVRTKDCVNRAAAESLKARALASGFQGVFLVRYVSRH